MRTITRTIAATAAALLIMWSVVPGQTPATGRLMRDKLRYSQDLLEAVMTSNFDQLTRTSEALVETTKMPAWAILETPEYEHYSAAFLKHTRLLQEAAQQRDSDGAFMAYLGLNLTCYQCHRYIKGQRVAH